MAKKGISRRQFMEASIVGTAAARMPGLDRPERATAASADELDAAGGQGGRLMLSLNPSWRFKHQETPGAGVEPEFLGAAQPGYNDSSWETVVVPHTWDATADNPFCVTNHFRGLAWYRREVEIPDSGADAVSGLNSRRSSRWRTFTSTAITWGST